MSITLIKKREPKIESKIKEVTVKSYWLYLRDLRLDASFYAEDAQKAIRILQESEYEITSLGSEDISKKIFNPPPIKREYSGLEGTPYLTPTELFQFIIKPTKYVFTSKMENIEDWFVKEDWVIITQSGRVGVPLFVTKSLEKFVVSQNAIRLIPSEGVYSGFIYAYLSTWMGQALINKDQFGVTVDHIRPHHVADIPIPIIPQEIQLQVHNNIKKAYDLRERAKLLMNDAEIKLYKNLNLPQLQPYTREIKTFTKNSSKIKLRFDASYHNPSIDEIIVKLQKGKNPVEKIGKDFEAYIPPRFKRIYVEEDYGLPFLQGSDIHLIRPRLKKYLSEKVTKHLNQSVVQDKWVLVTRSGTVGRVSLVPLEWDGWAVSEHVARIIPKTDEVHKGFLTIFLMSEYGYQQVISKIYGGVVDELTEEDIEDVNIPMVDYSIQKEIGELVVEAYELRELSNRIEDETVKLLEEFLIKHKKSEILTESDAYMDTFELIQDEEFIESLNEIKKGELIPFNTTAKEK